VILLRPVFWRACLVEAVLIEIRDIRLLRGEFLENQICIQILLAGELQQPAPNLTVGETQRIQEAGEIHRTISRLGMFLIWVPEMSATIAHWLCQEEVGQGGPAVALRTGRICPAEAPMHQIAMGEISCQKCRELFAP
jgi:hypothetical protein